MNHITDLARSGEIPSMDRRTMLSAGAAAIAVSIGAAVKSANAELKPVLAFPVSKAITVDTLTPDGPGFDATAALAAGLDAAVVDLNSWPRDNANAKAALRSWRTAFARDRRLRPILSGRDFAAARRSGQFGVVLASQDASILGTPRYYADEDNLEELDGLHALGLRVLQLTYTDATGLGDGYREPRNAGLTLLGHAVVKRMNANRMVIDLSHCGDRTTADAIASSVLPCAVTHAACRALYASARNKSDATIKALGDQGGYFGVFNMTLWMTHEKHASVTTIVDHIDHAVKVGGTDLVGFGSDHEIMGDHSPQATQVASMQSWIKRNGSLPGGEPTNGHITAGDLNGPDRMQRIAWELHRRKYSDEMIDKIIGENFVRYFTRVCG